MAFQMRDETAGQNILYIDNSGNAGLGSLPNSGEGITVHGNGLFSTSAALGNGVLVPGSQAGYEGIVAVPANSTASVAVSTAQIPNVTSTIPTSAVSTTDVVFGNQNSFNDNSQYSIW